MRVVTFMIILESNTFSPMKADLDHFKKGNLFEGAPVLEYHTDKNTEMGGFISIAQAESIELIPALSAWGVSAGKVTKECYTYFRKMILKTIKHAGQIDGVLCSLHGAMVAEHSDDPEGDLLADIRAEVGDSIPIVSTLDFHANVTEKMVEAATVLVGYKTNPHVDFFECGKRAARIFIDAVKGTIQPTMAVKRLPMILPPENLATTQGPMVEEIQKTIAWEKGGNVISASIFAVQPWMDISNLGWSLVVVTDNDQNGAQKLSGEMATSCWEKRTEFEPSLVPIEDAIRKASEAKDGVFVFSDSADSVTGGAPGDSTSVLKALLDSKSSFPAALIMTDAQVVEKCIKKGVGKKITVKLGGKLDTLFHSPAEVKGYIKAITDGQYVLKGPAMTGLTIRMGTCVVLVVKKSIHMLVTEHPSYSIDPAQYRSVGIEPADMRAVMVKSPNMFRPAYQDIAREILVLDLPGICSANLKSMPFKRIPRPMYPFDDMTDYRVS